MTDDQTRAYETPQPADPPAPGGQDVAAASAETSAQAGTAPAGPGTNAAASSAATMPVGATAAAGASRMRWILGLGAAGVVLALTAGAVLLLGGSSTPEVLRYVPADAAVVMEVRMDLPGDQMQKLGNLLAHFPGFADQSTLAAKLDEGLGKLVSEGSDGKVDYVTDVKPWLNGPLFLAGDATAMSDTSGGSESFLIAATTNNVDVCAQRFEGQQVTHETYRGLDLTLSGDGRYACAMDGRFALAGDPASVRKAVDTKAAGSGMDKSNAYLGARKALSGEQLATAWISGTKLEAAMPSPDASMAVPGLDALSGRLPEWLVFGIRAEDDALLVDMVTAPVPAAPAGPSLLTMPPAHPSTIASLVPGDTMVYLEAQGTGVALQNLLTMLRTIPDIQDSLQVLDGMAKPEELVGWVEDLGVAVSVHGTDASSVQPEVAILLVAKDATTATDKVASLRTLLALAASGSSGIEVKQEDVAGVSVTTLTVTDLGAVIPPGSIPELGNLPAGTLSFSIAARDRVVYLTAGDGTMAKVLGVAAGSSLADDATFKQAATRAIANSQGTFYVAVGATVDFVEPLLPADAASQWTTEVAPYVDPVRAVAGWTSTDASGSRSRFVVTVATP